MFKSMKRIIKWAGKYKGRLYLGSVFSFFSSLSTAIPTMAAAYALDKAIAAYWAGNTIESSLIWQTLWITVGSIEKGSSGIFFQKQRGRYSDRCYHGAIHT